MNKVFLINYLLSLLSTKFYLLASIFIIVIACLFIIINIKSNKKKGKELEIQKENRKKMMIENNCQILCDIFDKDEKNIFKDFYNFYHKSFYELFSSLERMMDKNTLHYIYCYSIGINDYVFVDSDDLSFESSFINLLYEIKKYSLMVDIANKRNELNNLIRLAKLITLDSFISHFQIDSLSEVILDDDNIIKFINKKNKIIIVKTSKEDYNKIEDKFIIYIN